MRKKLLSIILALSMLACMIPMGALTAFAYSVDLWSAFFSPANGDTSPDITVLTKSQNYAAYVIEYADGFDALKEYVKDPNASEVASMTKIHYDCASRDNTFDSQYRLDKNASEEGLNNLDINPEIAYMVVYYYADTTEDPSEVLVIKNNPDYGLNFDDGEESSGWMSYTHTHTAGTEYMTDGRAHWLACADADCPLNKAEDSVLEYEMAFASYEGPELKETLSYSEEAEIGLMMGRQGKIEDGNVSTEIGRTIIPLTQTQLDNIGNTLVIVGCDDSDDNKPVYASIDCAYTYFYNGETKIEAAGMKNAQGEDVAAFVILDNDGLSGTITGYGYYRIYSDSVDGTFIGDILFKAPRTFKAVYNENGDQSLNFYFDCKDHSDEGKVFENGADNYLFDGTKEDNTNWGYNDIRDSIKGVVIDKSVIKYKGLTDTSYMFYSMTYADSIVGAEYLDVSNVTVMVLMFCEFGNCSYSLTQAPDISNWNTGNVTAMDFMFLHYGDGVESLNFILDLSGWNLSKVKASRCTDVFDSCCQSGTWKVTIPATAGEQLNDDTHWYVGDGTDPDCCIVPADGRSFTLAN